MDRRGTLAVHGESEGGSASGAGTDEGDGEGDGNQEFCCGSTVMTSFCPILQ